MSDKPAALSPVKVAVVAAAVILVVLFAVLSQRHAGSSAAPEVTASASASATAEESQSAQSDEEAAQEAAFKQFLLTDLPRRAEGDPLATGSVDATIVMTEWADYRCPYCSVFNEDILPELSKYVDNGTLRIEFRDLALFGDDSVYAATAARAAGEQGKYFEFQKALFAFLPNDGHPDVDEAIVTKIAKEVGLDVEQFTKDLADPALKEAVLADTEEGQAMGLGSIPSFVVGDTYFTGAQPLEFFQATIEGQVKELV